jgi:short-subunit dehydrogenase
VIECVPGVSVLVVNAVVPVELSVTVPKTVLPSLNCTALIGSVSGWAASPGASPYAMSKFAVRALANSITPELQLAGVKVTLISPGFVASEIRQVDNQGKLHEGAKDPIPTWLVMKTEKAARRMLRAVAKGKREAIITGHGKALVALERFAPWALRAVGRKMAAGRGGYRTEVKAE